MATDYKLKGNQSAFGAILEGLKTGTNDQAKSRRKINEMITRAEISNHFSRERDDENHRFQIAKMMAEDRMTDQRNMFKRDQELEEEFPDQYQPRKPVLASGQNFLSPEELSRNNAFYESIRQERSKRLKNKEKKGSAITELLSQLNGNA